MVGIAAYAAVTVLPHHHHDAAQAATSSQSATPTGSPTASVSKLHSPKFLLGVAGETVPAFEKTTGAKVSLSMHYVSMANPVSPGLGGWLKHEAAGAETVIEIEPFHRTLAQIAAGDTDSWLRALQHQLKLTGKQVVVSFAPEPNGNWNSWGDQPVLFKRAWRHVRSVMGTKGVTWLWQMSSSPHHMFAFWPGASQVDWVGLDGYFETPGTTFYSLFGRSVADLHGFTTKKILLAETAAGPGTGHMGKDIRLLFAGIQNEHLLGVVWFDIAQHATHRQDWRLEDKGNSAALKVFRQAIASS
jgi:Glycosyl hydrolase family 26